jgi:hypothetical protein
MTGSPELGVVLGAPRSGTTWLQRLLASSPKVASPQETHLFDIYLRVQWRRWAKQEADLVRALDGIGDGGQPEDRVIGLPTILDKEDLLDSQRVLVERVVSRALATKPGASIVIEKTPSNSLCVDMIDRLCPTARFLHIIRDPRDVMASLRDISASWAGGWAPRSAVGAAKLWLCHVEGARRAAILGPERYLEIRYEDLRRDTAAVLTTIVDYLGLPDDAASLVAAQIEGDGASFSEVFAFRSDISARLSVAPGREPAGFRGNGRRPLSPIALQAADTILGATARDAGYTSGWSRRSVLGHRVLTATALVQHALHHAARIRR